MNDEIRKFQPHIVVNPRMHGYGDFQTPECQMPDALIDGWWELCDILPNGGWGYDKGHENYKSIWWMLSRFTKVRGGGGNYLVNVSPRPSGEMPDVYYKRMDELTEWMKYNAESVFDVQAGEYPKKSNLPVTVRENRWYLHIGSDLDESVLLSDIKKPKSLKMLRNDKLGFSIAPELRTDSFDVVVVDF